MPNSGLASSKAHCNYSSLQFSFSSLNSRRMYLFAIYCDTMLIIHLVIRAAFMECFLYIRHQAVLSSCECVGFLPNVSVSYLQLRERRDILCLFLS